MKKTIIVLVLVIILITTMSIPCFAYNRASAYLYANQYWHSYNVSNYTTFIVNGDCTNFVSQCLFAGGLTKTTTWKYVKADGYPRSYDYYTSAWVNANDLKNYVKNNLGAPILAPKWKKVSIPSQNTYAYVNDSSNILASDSGKVIVFYDWTDDGIIDHSAILVQYGVDQDGYGATGDLISAHSTNHYKAIWNLDYYNSAHRYTTAVYAFRLPV